MCVSLQVEDTVLAKLLAQSTNITELHDLLQEANDIVLSEVEPVFRQTGRYRALCMIYQQRREDHKLLDVWSKCIFLLDFPLLFFSRPTSLIHSRLVDGEWTDNDIADPITSMITLLGDRKDRTLTHKWGIWLTKRDPERGLKVPYNPISLASDIKR